MRAHVTMRVFGRPIRPVAFGFLLTMLVVASANYRGMDRGTELPIALVVAALATVSAGCLLTGWWANCHRCGEIGLLLVASTYAVRGALIMLASPWDQAVFFSLASVIIAGGSYVLEVNARQSGAT